MNDPALKPNKTTKVLDPPEGSESLRPQPKSLFEDNPVNLQPLRKLKGKSIVSVHDFDLDVVIELSKLAAILENYEITPYHLLDGKVAITAFFEASTRTRLSFESAFQRLAGRILSIPEGGVTGAKKG
jgi:aspartate carbamoyltransferase catalytic subunit